MVALCAARRFFFFARRASSNLLGLRDVVADLRADTLVSAALVEFVSISVTYVSPVSLYVKAMPLHFRY